MTAPFVSYAQNREDVMLWRALHDATPGFYVDVGAHSPLLDSVTRAFHERGWHGLNIEPAVRHHAALMRHRPADVNLAVAIGDPPGRQRFFRIGDDNGLSTLDAALAERHSAEGHRVRATEVEVTTLAAIWRAHVTGPVHFLKIDVEGAERAVLAGAEFGAYRPWIILLEATEPNTQVPTHAQWEDLLTARDYRFVYFDGLNRFYLAAEHATRLAPAFTAPPNVFDRYVTAREDALARRVAALDKRGGR